MMDSSDPFDGWAIEKVLEEAPLAKNDIYGSLFFYLRKRLLRFCHQLENLNVHFELFLGDVLELPGRLKEYSSIKSFDRVDVSIVL